MYSNKLQDKTNPQGKFNNIMLFIFFTKPKLLNIFCWAFMYNLNMFGSKVNVCTG